jgi:hypothetical protein
MTKSASPIDEYHSFFSVARFFHFGTSALVGGLVDAKNVFGGTIIVLPSCPGFGALNS